MYNEDLDQFIGEVGRPFATKPSFEVGGFRSLLSKIAAPGEPAPDADLVQHEQGMVAGEEPLPAEGQAASAMGAPDTTGHLEGEFAVPVEQVVMTLAQVVSNSMRQHTAYAYYGEMMRGLGRGELAELFDAQGTGELEEMKYFLRRMSVLHPGGVPIPLSPTPQPSADPLAALEFLIAGEQQAIVLFKALHAQLGDNPMKFTIEELQSHAQEHLDKLWQYMPADAAPAQTAAVASAAKPETAQKVKNKVAHAILKKLATPQYEQALAAGEKQPKPVGVPSPGSEPINAYLGREQQLAAAQAEAEKQDMAMRLEEMTAHAQTQQAIADQANMAAQQSAQQAEQSAQQAAIAQEQAMASSEAASMATTQTAQEAEAKMRLSMRIQQMRQELMNMAAVDPVAEEGLSHGGGAGAGIPLTPAQQQEQELQGAMDPTGGTGQAPSAGAAQQQGEAVNAQADAAKQTSQAQEKTKEDVKKPSGNDKPQDGKPNTTISVKTSGYLRGSTPLQKAASAAGLVQQVARRAPPIPAAARLARPAGGMFTPAAGPSPFMGLGPAAKLGPARAVPAGSMQTPQFLARQPGGKAMLESVSAVDEISRMPNKQQSLTLSKRLGVGSDVAAHRAHLANQQGMTHLASLELSRFIEELKTAGTLPAAATARAREFLVQTAKQHATVRKAIPNMAADAAKIRAAAEARHTVPFKSFPKPVDKPVVGTTAVSKGMPGSSRQRPAWAPPKDLGTPISGSAPTLASPLRPR